MGIWELLARFRRADEPEYEETVEHDTVMVGGRRLEVTEDNDPEVRE